MNKEQELKKEIELKNKEIKAIMLEKNKVEGEYAKLKCPHKIGDVLIDNSGIKARLTKILFDSMFGVAYKLYGVKIKKNGEDYSHQSELHEYQGWKALGEVTSPD